MNEQCGIIRDLLPLYHDGVCSDESRTLVEEHLKSCEACSMLLENIRSEFRTPHPVTSTDQASVDVLKRFRSKILKKNVIVGLASVLSAVVVFGSLYWFACGYQTPLKYHEGMLTVNEAYDGVIDVFYNDGRYACARGFEKETEKDGVMQRVVYLNYSSTFWTRHFAKATDRSQTQFTMGENLMVDYGGAGGMETYFPGSDETTDDPKISVVYEGGMETYFPGLDETTDVPKISAVYYIDIDLGARENIEKLSFANENEFAKLTENAVLLWER